MGPHSTGKTVVVTGASGVKPRLVLERFNAFLKGRGKEPIQVIDFEDRLVHFALNNPVCATSKCFQQALNQQGPIIAVTSLPYSLLRTLWTQAMAGVCDEVTALTKTGLNVALVLHAVYFNAESNALVPIIDSRVIEPIRPTCVIQLIDDVYDTYRWLRSPGGAFDQFSYPQDKFDQIQRTIQQLIGTLGWRQAEAGAGLNLAGLLGDIPHFTLATKHRCRLLEQIFEENPHRIYLSHPISEARRRAAMGDRTFFEAWCSEVRSLADHLSRELAVWEPTTIDELRFCTTDVNLTCEEQDPPNKMDIDLPRLLQRWPFQGVDEILWPEAPSQPDEPLDPAGLFSDEDVSKTAQATTWEGVEKALGTRKSAQLRSISGQLLYLRTLIMQQINIRDRALVGQCPTLVVYRPVFNGSKATGVLREIQAHQRLVELQHYGDQPLRPMVFVLENSDDERLVWKNVIAGFCAPSGRWSGYVRNTDGAAFTMRRAEEIAEYVTEDKDKLEAEKVVGMMAVASRELRFAWNEPKGSVLDDGPKGQAWADFVDERKGDLDKAARERFRYREVLSHYTPGRVFLVRDISVIDFADRIIKGLT